jgi:hypothetical protein
MSISERFACYNQKYILDRDNKQDSVTITVSSTISNKKSTQTKTYIYYGKTKSTWTSITYGRKIPPELDDALMIYIQHGGFAGLTLAEYLRSLELAKL